MKRSFEYDKENLNRKGRMPVLTSKKQVRKRKQRKIRNSEYYDMEKIFDDLYAQGKTDKVFNHLMEIIESEENIKLAYRNIKRNSGSSTAGVDHRTIDNLAKLSEEEYVRLIRKQFSNYHPRPVRRVEIEKDNGKKRPLGIPTIVDRMVQQCILQVMEPICEAKFSENSNGFRPNRSAETAIAQCMRLIQVQHMYYVVDLDIKGFFDNINHRKLLRQIWALGIRDKKLICIIKEMLKAPVILPDGKRIYPEKGTPQGGILSPLLANIYLNEFDQEFQRRGVPCIRYADDIVLLAKSERASKRLLESSTKYLEETLELKVNRKKSRTVSVFAIRNFKYLGFCYGKNGKGIYIRVHADAWKKAKDKLRKLTSRSRCGNIRKAMERIKIFMRGWLNYFSIADMKNNIEAMNGWLYRRIRMCIWKQWKLPKTRKRKLLGLGLPEWAACEGAYSRKGYWRMAGSGVVQRALTKERLIRWGCYDLSMAYQSLHVNC